MEAKTPISLVMAIADHPWTKATKDSAAVRIAMTVAAKGKHDGVLREVVKEEGLDTDAPVVEFTERAGRVNADLTVGIDITSTFSLTSNKGLAHKGFQLNGDGFVLKPSEAALLGEKIGKFTKRYFIGRDINQYDRGLCVLDFHDHSEEYIRKELPRAYQLLLEKVRPIRSSNPIPYRRDNWWLFGRPGTDLRDATSSLERIIITARQGRHRIFSLALADSIPESTVVVITVSDNFIFGVLHSKLHEVFSLKAGGWLGAGNDSRYFHTKTFEPFPFPLCDNALKTRIRTVAEELDAFRKARQEEHPGLTLTQMYNVLEKLKAGGALTPDEERIKEQGLILILKELHEKLDALVFEAYGWPQGLSDEDILARLVALNAERAAEEERGIVHWLRPEYQIPRFGSGADKQAEAEAGAQESADLVVLEREQKRPFPASAIEQAAEVFAALAAARGPVDAATIASAYRQGRKAEPKIAAILAAAARIGEVASLDDGRLFAFRRAA